MGYTNHAPTHSPLLPTPIHCHPLSSTPTEFHSILPQYHLFSVHSHPLPLMFSHPFLSTPTHFYSILIQSHSFSAHSYPLLLLFSSLLLILSPALPMCNLSRPFLVHIQILSPNPTHHLPFQPIFSPCVLRAYVSFNVNLFFLLFSVCF